MTIALSGSIAFDYLMTFPGRFKDHILPDRLDRLSLSFLVDSLERRRGGIAANIAYTLALLGEHPKVVGTVGEDFEGFRAWLESKGVDTSSIGRFRAVHRLLRHHRHDQLQIASFYTGAMASAGDLKLGEIEPLVAGRDLGQRPHGDAPPCRGMPDAGHPICL
jgi:adenosine kinase